MSAIHGSLGFDDGKQYLSHSQDGIYDNLIGLDVVHMATSEAPMRETELVKGKIRPAVAAKPSVSYQASAASSSLSSRSSASSSVSAIPTDVTNRSFASSTSGCEFSPLSHSPRVLNPDSQSNTSTLFVKETSPSRVGTSLHELRDALRPMPPLSLSPRVSDPDSQSSPVFLKETSPTRTSTSIHELRGASRQKSPSPLNVDLMFDQLDSSTPNKAYHRNAKSSEDFRASAGNKWAITDEILISSDRDVSRKPVVIGRDLRQAIIQLQSVPTLRWNLGPLFSDDDIVETPSSHGESSVGLLSSVEREVSSVSDSDVQVSSCLEVPGVTSSSKQSELSRGSTGSDTVFYDSVSSRDISNSTSVSTAAVDVNKNFNASSRTCESFEEILENISSSEDVRNSDDFSDIKCNEDISMTRNSETNNVSTKINVNDVRTVSTTAIFNSKSETVSSSLFTTKIKTTVIKDEQINSHSEAKPNNSNIPRTHSPHQRILDKDYNLNFKLQKVRKHELQPQLADFKIERAPSSEKDFKIEIAPSSENAPHSIKKAGPSRRSELLKELDVVSVRSESPDSVVERILEAAGANTSAVDENDIPSSRNREVELEKLKKNDSIFAAERNDMDLEESRRKTDSMSIHETVVERLTYTGERSPKTVRSNRIIPQKRSPKPPVPVRTDKLRKVESSTEKKRPVNGSYAGPREKSPEEIFEEIVESLNTNMSEDDSVAEFDEKSDAETSADERRSAGRYQCRMEDFSVENEWGSVYYSKSLVQKVPVTSEEPAEVVRSSSLHSADVNGNLEMRNAAVNEATMSLNSDVYNSQFSSVTAANDEVVVNSSVVGAKNMSEISTRTTSVEVIEISTKGTSSSISVLGHSDYCKASTREDSVTQSTSERGLISSSASCAPVPDEFPLTSNGDIYFEELDLDLEKELKMNSRGFPQNSDRKSNEDINAMLDDGDEIFSNSDNTVIRKSRTSEATTSVDSETFVNQKYIEEPEVSRAKPLRRFSSRKKKNSIDKSAEVVQESISDMSESVPGSVSITESGEFKRNFDVTSSTDVTVTSSSHVCTTYALIEREELRSRTEATEENRAFVVDELIQRDTPEYAGASTAGAISPKVKPEVPLKPTVIRKTKLDRTNNSSEELTVNSLLENSKGIEHRSSSSEEYAESNSSSSTIIRKNSSEENMSEYKSKSDVTQQEKEATVAKTESLVSSDPVKAEPLVPGAIVLSEEVTTQEIVLKIAWPKGRRRMGMPRRPKNNQVAVGQPFRQLHLHRLIRMSQFDQDEENDADENAARIQNGTMTDNSITQKEIASIENSGFNGNLSATETSDVSLSQEKLSGRTSPVVVLANLGSSTAGESSDVQVEYVKQSSSSETEQLDEQSAVDVRRNECIKVLRVPARSVYRVPNLRSVVESVSNVILQESNQLPEDCDVSVTCEAVETRSRAAVEGTSNVTVIHRAILDPKHSSSKSPIPSSSPSNV